MAAIYCYFKVVLTVETHSCWPLPKYGSPLQKYLEVASTTSQNFIRNL